MDLSSSEFATESTGALCVKLAPNSVGLSVEPVDSNISENDEEDGEEFSAESSDYYIPETDEEEDNLEGDLASGAGYCFLWDENHGHRGSEEIGTTLLKMLNNLPESVTDVILYSDCCGGQNRNRLIATLLLHMNHSLHFNSITIKYLQSGHTQMEADSMHSAIERAKRNICVYSPEEWPTILRLARRKNPYAVERLNYSDIIDLKTAFSKLNHNLKKNVNNESVNWLKIKVLQVIKSEKRQLLYKEQWNEDFKVIDIDGSRMKKKGVTNFTLTHKYKKELPISDTKLKDLKDLCKKNVIPPGSQTFFLNLQGGNNRDCLDEPDRFEEEDEDDNK